MKKKLKKRFVKPKLARHESLLKITKILPDMVS